ncbi:MAG: hypothetical protein FWG89_11155 [Treponema sp.]|nr:hypothetical protein [Treponema sp.]
MKKTAATCALIFFACSGVFAEKPFTVTVDTLVDGLYIRKFTGDYGSNTPAQQGSPYLFQADGTITGFQSSAFDNGIRGRLGLSYTGERLGGLLQLRGNFDTTAMGDWKDLDIWDWEAWARPAPWVRVLAGNQVQRGEIAYYHNFEELLTTRLDGFGIMQPEWQRNPVFSGGNNFDTTQFPWGYSQPGMNMGFARFWSTDTNNLFLPAGMEKRKPLNVLVDLDFGPLVSVPVTLSASVGGLFSSTSEPFDTPFGIFDETRLIDYNTVHPPVLTNNFSFGLRLESAEIAELFSLAAVYKHSESLLSKPQAVEMHNMIGEVIRNHAFGLYANITPLEDFGISVGYSGELRTQTNPLYRETRLVNMRPEEMDELWGVEYGEIVSPFYNGIDLRFSYTGLERFAFTLNNNITFARMQGVFNDDTNAVYANSWAYRGYLNDLERSSATRDRSESYLGLYNALGVKYSITPSLAADVQAANQYGVFKLKWERDDARTYTNYFGLYSGLTYTITERENMQATLQGGIALRLSSYFYDDPGTGITCHRAGIIEFGIPLRLKVEF